MAWPGLWNEGVRIIEALLCLYQSHCKDLTNVVRCDDTYSVSELGSLVVSADMSFGNYMVSITELYTASIL